MGHGTFSPNIVKNSRNIVETSIGKTAGAGLGGSVGGGSALTTDPHPPPAPHLCRIQATRNMLHLKRIPCPVCHSGQVSQKIAETSKRTTILGSFLLTLLAVNFKFPPIFWPKLGYIIVI